MGRLTEKLYKKSTWRIKECGSSGCDNICEKTENCFKCPIQKAIDKLAEYEDLDEQGKLLKLPCKLGDTVYRAFRQRDNFSDREYNIITASTFRLDMLENIGKTVFLTREAAEAALKEMESMA